MPLGWSEFVVSCQFCVLLFQRLSYQPSKNVAGILASAGVLVTGVPSLQPRPGFCRFGDPDLGCGEILLLILHRGTGILSCPAPKEGSGRQLLVNMAGFLEQVLQSVGSRGEGNAKPQISAPSLIGCVMLGKLLNLSGHQFPNL